MAGVGGALGSALGSLNLLSPQASSKPAAPAAIQQLQNYQAPLPGITGGSSGGGGGGGGTSQPAASAPSGGGGGGGSSAPSIDFNAIYDPIISNLQSLAGTLQSNETQDLGQVDTQKQTLTDQQNAQNAQLIAQNQGNYDTTNQSIQSAYNSALKQYQDLYQQYGTGFAGAGYGDNNPQSNLSDYEKNQLQQQSILSQNGLINSDTENTNNFNNNTTSIGTWNAGQTNQIQQWYSQAYDTLQGQLQSGLAQIRGDTAMAESDKAQAQMAFANEWAQQQMALQDYATQFSNEMQVANSMSGQMGTNSAAAVSNMLGTYGQQASAIQQAAQQSPNNLLGMAGVQNVNQNQPTLGFLNFNNQNQSNPMSGILNSIGQQSSVGNGNAYAGMT